MTDEKPNDPAKAKEAEFPDGAIGCIGGVVLVHVVYGLILLGYCLGKGDGVNAIIRMLPGN